MADMDLGRVEKYTETNGNRQRSVTRIYDSEGAVTGTISVTRSVKKGSARPRRAPYSYKQLSSQLMRAKTSGNVSRVLVKMRNKRMQLINEKRRGEYDETEIALAIIHAEAIERVAKKRKKNLQMEERAEAEQESEEYDKQLEEAADPLGSFGGDDENSRDLSEEEMDEILSDIENEMKELMEEMEENAKLDESLKEMTQALSGDMSPEDLDELKKKHRSEEQRDIIRADMKYLKALFDKLSRDKASAASGGSSSSSSSTFSSGPAASLSLSGGQMSAPAAPAADIPEASGDIDIAV